MCHLGEEEWIIVFIGNEQNKSWDVFTVKKPTHLFQDLSLEYLGLLILIHVCFYEQMVFVIVYVKHVETGFFTFTLKPIWS